MTPFDFCSIAREAYTAAPDIGVAGSASRAIVRRTPAGQVVAFPGTDNFRCLETDFDVLTVDVPGAGAFHAGFWRAWESIETDVFAAVAGNPTILVGHSLGAALAIAAATAMVIGGRPPVAVYGFEPPRISPDLQIKNALANVPVYLYQNGRDFVPLIPPGWEHAAQLIGIGTASLPIPNVEDHLIENVLKALRN